MPEFEDAIENLDREDLIKLARSLLSNGVALSFHGKRSAMEIARRVRPRIMRREPKLHVGSPAEQARNLLVEGENLQAMVTLYKWRGQVDLIVTDPPYNTGNQFRYNDRWDVDPNDPDLGTLVSKEDGSRHTKWIKAMMPRLQMMKAMLRPSGVIAICIDDNELFHLGMMMDEVFGEENRLGIINWQKSAAPRPDNKHVSTSTEYVLVYAKDMTKARTGSLERGEDDNRRYANWDNDPGGDWREGNLTAKTYSAKADYAIQSPFTGELHYPAGNGAWRHTKKNIKSWLSEWGTPYEERGIRDGKEKALMVVGAEPGKVPSEVRERALEILKKGPWPFVWFGRDGQGRPRVKTYLEQIKKGKVPVTYWADDDFSGDEGEVEPTETGAVSWDYTESGRSSDGVSELTAIVGEGHGFTTVKPLKLFSKIIQIWCPPNGLVMDPYAGSGTTGHAVLELNKTTGATRRFILIEQGSPENGDKYARTLTWQRVHNVISGTRPGSNSAPPLGGGFEYRLLTKTIDARAVMTMKRDELIDVVITSHWENHRRTAPNLQRIDEEGYQYLIGRDETGEGYFLIWNNGGPVGSVDLDSYKVVAAEAKRAGIKPPFHVYARYEDFQSPNVRFWKIPDKILAHLGLDENERYNHDDEAA
ncbi:DNA methyltransferase [Microvirga arsenatis]|uniref:DNA methyltransferase n=1 Tax=Microvirga arsenatis TaxID=2692265 RepID=UPI00191C638B